MNDADKTKEQLITELVALRQQAAELIAMQAELTQTIDLLQSERVEHSQMIQTLRDSEQRVDLVYKAANIGEWELDLPTRTYIIGQRRAEMLGFNLDEVGTHFPVDVWSDWIHPDDQLKVMQTLEEILSVQPDSAQKDYELEYRLRDNSGEWQWILSRVAWIEFDGQDTPRRVVGVMIDIDEHKRAEKAFRRTQHTIDSSRTTIQWVRPDARFMYVNEAGCNQLGYSLDELLNMSVPDIDPNWPVEYWFSEGWERIKLAGQWTFESQHRRKDGTLFPVEITATYGEFEGEEYVFALVTDITERKTLEKLLRRTQHTIDSGLIPTLWVAPDSSIMYANAAICDQLGYLPGELMSLKVSEFDLDWTDDYWYSEGWKRIKAEGQWTFESRNFRKNGTIFPVEVTATYGEFEGQEYVFAFVIDITERRQLETEAKEAEILRAALEKEKELVALKDRIVSVVSHEFRTPLTVIRLTSDTLLQYVDRLDQEKRNQKLQLIKEQSTHLTHLIDGTLAMSRAQQGKTEFNPSLLDIEAFCYTVFDQIQFTDTVRHQFEFTGKAPEEPIMIDANLLQHILTNLLTNAVKYSPEGTRIAFELDHGDNTLIIKISDEGIGIPEEDLARLFDPFHRASNVGSAQGTGLGLSIAKEYVELHGGHMEVESEVGKGSAFTIWLPMT